MRKMSTLWRLFVLSVCFMSFTVVIGQTVTSYPYIENFDTFPVDNVSFGPGAEPNPFPNNWNNLLSDAASQDWYGRSVATGSSNTGPSSDHTGSGSYVFVEDGYGTNTDVTLESPKFYLNGTGSVVASVWVHSHTASTTANSLDIDVWDATSGTWSTDTTIGDIGNVWTQISVDLTSHQGDTVQVRFVCDNSTTSFQHDIAIDDFSVEYLNFNASGAVVADNVCSEDMNGVLTASYQYNSGAVSYSWSTGATSDTITGLANGTYTLTISDASGAADTVTMSVGSTYTSPTYTVASTDVLCNGGSTGVAAITMGTFNSFIPTCGDTTSSLVDTSSVSNDTLGNGTSTNSTTGYPALFGNWYWGAKHQLIYRASELTAAGISSGYITGISIPVTSVNGTANYSNYRIAMGCTTDSTLTAGWVSGLTEVMSPISHTVTSGWNDMTFNTPFYWDGTSNIVLQTCFNNSGYTNNSTTPYTNMGYTAVRYYRADISTVCSNTSSTTGTSANRPNVVFKSNPQLPLSSPVSYAWGSGATTSYDSALAAGIHNFTVTDYYCSVADTVSVSEPTVLMATSSVSDALCNGDSTGEASVSISGGVGGGGASLLISEVGPGSPDFIEIMNVSASPINVTGYKVVVSNSYTAIGTINTTTWNLSGTMASGAIMYREDVTGTNYWGNNLFWNGGSNSWAIIIDGSGNIVDALFWGWDATSISNFSISVAGQTVTNNGAWTGAGFNSTCSNSYTRVGTDDNDDASDWSCTTITKGTANTNLTVPFAGGYNLAWSNGATASPVDSLSSGTYTYTVTDANNCTLVDSVTISEPTAITTSVSSPTDGFGYHVSCFNGNTGTSAVSASGGVGTYTYNWTGPGSFSAATDSVSNQSAGWYYVDITDTNNCVATDSVELTEPASAVTASGNTGANASCNGFTDGIAEVSPGGGIPGYIFLWSNGSTDSTNSGVGAGNYSVTVTDANNCTAVTNVQINEPAAIVTGIDTVLNPACSYFSTGTITATAGGGTPPLTFAWSNGTTQLINSGLADGWYFLSVTDANGCVEVDSAMVDAPDALSINVVTQQNAYCESDMNGEIEVALAGGTPNYTPTWSNGVTGTLNDNLSAGEYVLSLVDANNCMLDDTITIGFDHADPQVSLGSDTTIVPGVVLSFDAGNAGGTYLWSDGSTNQTNDLTASLDSTIWVEVTSDAGCVGSDTVVVDVAVSVNERLENLSFKYYPNPTRDMVFVDFSNSNQVEIKEIQMLSSKGQMIERQTRVQSLVRFDLSQEAVGTYFIRLITTNGEVITKPVVKH